MKSMGEYSSIREETMNVRKNANRMLTGMILATLLSGGVSSVFAANQNAVQTEQGNNHDEVIIHTGKLEGAEGSKVWTDKGSLTVAGNTTIKGNTQVVEGKFDITTAYSGLHVNDNGVTAGRNFLQRGGNFEIINSNFNLHGLLGEKATFVVDTDNFSVDKAGSLTAKQAFVGGYFSAKNGDTSLAVRADGAKVTGGLNADSIKASSIKIQGKDGTEEDIVTSSQLNAVAGDVSKLETAGIIPGSVDDSSSASTAIGRGSEIKRNSSSSVVIGQYATVDGGKNSTAVGQGAASYAPNGTAIGQGAEVWGDNAMAIGQNSAVSIHVGTHPTDSVALGTNAKVDGAVNSIALGTNSQVAFGEDNTVSFGSSVDSKTPDGKTVTAFTRRLTNISDGKADTDAATVGQVNAVKDGLAASGIAAGKVAKSDAENSVAVGTGSVITGGAWDGETNKAIPSNGTAIGAQAQIQSSAVNATVVGQNAQVYQSNATAIGQGARVASNATNGEGSVALGQGSFVGYGDANSKDTNGVVSVGQSGDTGFTRRIINVKDGINDTDAATVGQLNTLSNGLSEAGIVPGSINNDHKYALALGTNAAVNADSAIAIGNNAGATGEYAVSLGRNANAKGKDTTALGSSAIAEPAGSTAIGANAAVRGLYAANSVAIGANSVATESGVVSFGNDKDANGEAINRRLIHVADGEKDTDAVNKGQLDKVSGSVSDLSNLAVKYTNSNKTEVNLRNAELTGVSDISLRINSRGYSFTDAGLLPGKANGQQSTVIGAASQGTGDYATAVGNNSAAAANGLAVGAYANAAENSVVLGSGADSLAAPKAGQENSVVIGTYVDSNSANSTAIGYGAQIGWDGDHAVALGADSVAKEANVLSLGHKAGDSNGQGGTYAEDLKRRITNVADGNDDSDAATVGQIKSITGVDTSKGAAVQYDNSSKGRVTFAGTNGTSLENVSDISMKVTDPFNGKTTDNSFQKAGLVPGVSNSDYSTAIGKTAFGDPNIGKNSNQSVSIGDAAQIKDDSKMSIALGYNSSVGSYDGGAQRGIAIGTSSNVSKNESIAIGTEAQNNTQNAVAIGDHAVIQEGAVNSIAIGGLYQYSEEGGLGGGGNYQVEKDAKDSVVIGAAGLSQSAGATVLGTGARVTSGSENSVALGAGSVVGEDDLYGSDTHGVVSVGNSMGGKSDNFTRRIINVADGKADSDAATVKQVNAVKDSVTSLNKLAVTYTDASHKEIKLFDTKITNVGDISMNVDDAFSNKTNTASFKEAGLVPGISESAFSTAIGKTSFGDPNIGKNSNQSVTIGDAAQITDNSKQSIALGYNSSVGSYFGGAERGIAIGASSNVAKKQSIAIGTEAKNNTQNAVAIGDHAVIQEGAVNSIAIGGLYRYGEEGGLGGGGNYQVEKDAKDSVVIGAAGLSQSAGATAIGTGARVSFDADHSVALGEDSEVLADDIQATDTHGVVSVGNAHAGSDSFTRRIINVADGINDNDAVNKKQLDAVTENMSDLSGLAVKFTNSDKEEVNLGNAQLTGVSDISMRINNRGYSFTEAGLLPGKANGYQKSTVIGAASQGTGDYATAVGNNSAAAANGLAVGAYANAAKNSVVLGSGADSLAAPKAGKENSVAIGTYVDSNSANSTAIGYGAQIGWDSDHAVALGADSTANEENILSIGHKKGESNGQGGTYAEDLNRRITNVAAGINDTDAVTVGQIKDWKGVDVTKGQAVQYDKDGSLNVNKENSSLKVNSEQSSISHGENSVTASASGVNITNGTNSIKVDNEGTTITGKTTVKGDLNITGNLSIGGEKIATENQIKNVVGDINGLKTTVGTDKVSVKDLNGKDVTTLTGAVNANAAKIGDTARLKDITGKEHSTLTEAAVANHNAIEANTSAINQNRQDIASLGHSVNKLGNEVDSVGALSAALAGLHPIDDGGLSKFQLSAAMGTYDGTQALALGGFYNVSPDVRLSMGLSTNLNGGDRKMAGNVGATFLIGSGVSRSIKSTAEVNQQVEELQAANEAQQKEIDELKAQLQKLLAK